MAKILNNSLSVFLCIVLVFFVSYRPLPAYADDSHPANISGQLGLPSFALGIWELLELIAGAVAVGGSYVAISNEINSGVTDYTDWAVGNGYFPSAQSLQNEMNNAIFGDSLNLTLCPNNLNAVRDYATDVLGVSSVVADSSLIPVNYGSFLNIGDVTLSFVSDPVFSALSQMAALGFPQVTCPDFSNPVACYARMYKPSNFYNVTVTREISRISINYGSSVPSQYFYKIEPSFGSIWNSDKNANFKVISAQDSTAAANYPFSNSNYQWSQVFLSHPEFLNCPVYRYDGNTGHQVGSIVNGTFVPNDYGLEIGYTGSSLIQSNGSAVGYLEGSQPYIDTYTPQQTVTIYVPDTVENVTTFPDIEAGSGATVTDVPPSQDVAAQREQTGLLASILSAVQSIPAVIEGVISRPLLPLPQAVTWDDVLTSVDTNFGDKFPFCIPRDMNTVLTAFASSGGSLSSHSAPVFEVPVRLPSPLGGYLVNEDYELDLSDFDNLAAVTRIATMALMLFGLFRLSIWAYQIMNNRGV